MSPWPLLVVAIALLAFGLISKRAERSVLTPPIFFVLAGCLVSEHGLGLLPIDLTSEQVHALAELTLVLVLFTDASRIDLDCLRLERGLPLRLLGIGLPLTIALGTIAGLVLLPGLGLIGAALLAAILAPTDAALGQAVVSSPLVPAPIRQALNVESGLNDGIALPVVLMLASFASVEAGEAGFVGENITGYWLRFAALAVTLGPLVGVTVGWLGARALQRSIAADWMNAPFQRLAALGLALLAFAAAELIGGNGFISAFVAGLTIGNVGRDICPTLYEFGETEGQLLELIVFLIFGAALVPIALEHISWETMSYALLSLTLIRMLPVVLALLGSGLALPSVAFLAWFGPRGLASILFALVVIEEYSFPGVELVEGVVMLTVSLSIFFHGVTAYPLSSAYGSVSAASEGGPETRPVSELPVRVRHGVQSSFD